METVVLFSNKQNSNDLMFSFMLQASTTLSLNVLFAWKSHHRAQEQETNWGTPGERMETTSSVYNCEVGNTVFHESSSSGASHGVKQLTL